MQAELEDEPLARVNEYPAYPDQVEQMAAFARTVIAEWPGNGHAIRAFRPRRSAMTVNQVRRLSNGPTPFPLPKSTGSQVRVPPGADTPRPRIVSIDAGPRLV
jgi:hypothetical protein